MPALEGPLYFDQVITPVSIIDQADNITKLSEDVIYNRRHIDGAPRFVYRPHKCFSVTPPHVMCLLNAGLKRTPNAKIERIAIWRMGNLMDDCNVVAGLQVECILLNYIVPSMSASVVHN